MNKARQPRCPAGTATMHSSMADAGDEPGRKQEPRTSSAAMASPGLVLARKKIIAASIFMVVALMMVCVALAGQEWFQMKATANLEWLGLGLVGTSRLHFSVHGALWDDTTLLYTATGQADTRQGYINLWTGTVGADLEGTGVMSFNKTNAAYTCKKLRPQSDAEAWLKASLCENAIAIFVWLMLTIICLAVGTLMLFYVCYSGSEFVFGMALGLVALSIATNIAAVCVYAGQVVNAYETDFNSYLIGWFYAAAVALLGVKMSHGVGSSFVVACVAPAVVWHGGLLLVWARGDFKKARGRQSSLMEALEAGEGGDEAGAGPTAPPA